MYKYALLVAFAVFALSSAQTTVGPSAHGCRICEFILGVAQRHFNHTFTDEGALKTQLLTECSNIPNQDDQALCKTIVNNNIDKIYNDLKSGDHDRQTCVDIGYCHPRPSRAAPKRAKRQATQSPRRECEECDRLVGYAEYFYHRNPNTTQAQLQQELDHECTRRGTQQEQQDCETFVANNIATIYSDLGAGKRPFQICEDLGVCHGRTSAAPKRAKRQATQSPRRECDECDRLVVYAEYFYHRNPNVTQAQLQTELNHECTRRGTQQEQQECETFVANNIATIFSDLGAGKRPFQICEDLGACPKVTRAPAARFN